MLEDENDVPEPGFIKRIVQQTCTMFGQPQAQINVEIISDQKMIDLNQRYRGKACLTNVLAFPMQYPEWIDTHLLGDIALCASVIRREAQHYNKSLDARWAHMIVHGSLHLLGMLHDGQTNQKKMETMEKSVMEKLGYEDPYLLGSLNDK